MTLKVHENLTANVLAVGYLPGAPAQQWGNGELIVSGATVTAGGTVFIGGMGGGSLVVSAGGKFENNKLITNKARIFIEYLVFINKKS